MPRSSCRPISYGAIPRNLRRWTRCFPEIRGLRTIAQQNPEAVQPDLRPVYERGAINSISTLQRKQPVRIAGEKLLPRAGIPYHTIAGVLPGTQPPSDGAVPLDSANIPGAASTLVLASDHQIYDDPDAVAEVLRILHEDLATPVEGGIQRCAGN